MAEANEPRGDILMEWDFPEFAQHDRSRGWYLAFAIIVLALITFSIFTLNYTFAALLVLFSLVMLVRLRREPPLVHFAIRDEGVEVGKDYYAWREIKDFWIIYRPPIIKKVYFNFKASLRPALDISLEGQNPVKIRQYLSERLPENIEREEEPSGDQITRYLKI
jgi:hypothetical protein